MQVFKKFRTLEYWERRERLRKKNLRDHLAHVFRWWDDRMIGCAWDASFALRPLHAIGSCGPMRRHTATLPTSPELSAIAASSAVEHSTRSVTFLAMFAAISLPLGLTTAAMANRHRKLLQRNYVYPLRWRDAQELIPRGRASVVDTACRSSWRRPVWKSMSRPALRPQ